MALRAAATSTTVHRLYCLDCSGESAHSVILSFVVLEWLNFEGNVDSVLIITWMSNRVKPIQALVICHSHSLRISYDWTSVDSELIITWVSTGSYLSNN